MDIFQVEMAQDGAQKQVFLGSLMGLQVSSRPSRTFGAYCRAPNMGMMKTGETREDSTPTHVFPVLLALLLASACPYVSTSCCLPLGQSQLTNHVYSPAKHHMEPQTTQL